MSVPLERAWRRWRRGLFRAPRGPGPHYDHELIEVMRRRLAPGSCCVDGGAHLGDLLEAMLEAAPRGRHHAFEPLPRFAARLRRLFPDVAVHQAALAERAGRASFVHVADNPGYSGLRERAYPHRQPRLETLDVETTTLDAALGPEAEIALVKLDLEGGEHHALLGARGLLARCRPLVVFEAGAPSSSAYGVGPADFHVLLVEQLGYDLWTMRRWLAGEPPFTSTSFAEAWRTDFVFLAAPRGA